QIIQQNREQTGKIAIAKHREQTGILFLAVTALERSSVSSAKGKHDIKRADCLLSHRHLQGNSGQLGGLGSGLALSHGAKQQRDLFSEIRVTYWRGRRSGRGADRAVRVMAGQLRGTETYCLRRMCRTWDQRSIALPELDPITQQLASRSSASNN